MNIPCKIERMVMAISSTVCWSSARMGLVWNESILLSWYEWSSFCSRSLLVENSKRFTPIHLTNLSVVHGKIWGNKSLITQMVTKGWRLAMLTLSIKKVNASIMVILEPDKRKTNPDKNIKFLSFSHCNLFLLINSTPSKFNSCVST